MMARGRALAMALAATTGLALGACGDADGGADGAEPEGASSDTTTMVAPAGEAGDTASLVNPNEADAGALRSVPGLDSAAVAMILENRPYADMLALDEALSARMDSTARESLYRRLWIPLDLNTASEEEILLIPGVGSRMAHEFEEYRPYDAMARFRREIGKYVDDAEVARLERYVTIR